MTTQNASSNKTISQLLEECFAQAVAQGYNGSRESFEFSAEDLDWVVEQTGGKPTREEWREAGLNYVGDRHCASECAYCGHLIADPKTVPATGDDTAWAELAKHHADGCEWIATRAHRRDAA